MSYKKQNFVKGQTLTADSLNHIENGVSAIEKNQENFITKKELEEKKYATLDDVNDAIESAGIGASSAYISTELQTDLLLDLNMTFDLPIDFSSSNIGSGTLKVFINDIESFSAKIPQGGSVSNVPYDNFKKGNNTVLVYAIDRTGTMSNTLIFNVRYGGLEITPSFNSYIAYDQGTTIRYYFTPSSLDTSQKLTFYMKIDGNIDEQGSVNCTSDIRASYTFPANLDVGCHLCEAWISNGEKESEKHVFNFILIDDTSFAVATDTHNITIEEGEQISIDYKVYSKAMDSFIVKVYDNDTLINTGTCGLAQNYYRTNSLAEGSHIVKIEILDQNETVTDYCITNVEVTESTFTMLTPINTGACFIASAKNKSNTDSDRNIWIGKNQNGDSIEAILNGFSFDNKDGWGNDVLTLSGITNVEIPVAPLSDNARYGFTLDITFLTKPIGINNAEVLTLWNETNDCGIKITTEEVILKSANGNVCDLYFTENEMTNVMFIIDRDEKMAKIYLNGVMCEAFALSDYNDNGIDYLEDFTVNNNIYINKFGGYSQIKELRVYNLALTTNEIMNNFISVKSTKSEQKELLDFQNGNSLPTLTVYCDFSGLGKDDKKPCNIVYNSPDSLLYGESFVLENKTSSIQYQGTSSMAYPIKNYRINLRDENGDKWGYNPFSSGQPESRFCLKADFMSSGHWQNTGLAKWINDNLYQYDENDEKSMNPSKWHDVQHDIPMTAHREAINGFPCRLILINDGNTPLNEGQNEPSPGNTKDMGVFNFNNDKDNTDTMGFDNYNFPHCASYEVTANSDTSAGAFMSYDAVANADITELEYIKQSFELRFPDEDDVAEDWGFMGIPDEEGTGLKALIDWVDNCTDEEFVNDFEDHFHKDYTLRYFLLVITLGMVDNLGKNMMLDTWDNKIFMPRFYDCDTICSYDNTGQIKFDVDIEMEQGYWNTSASRLWTRIRDLMHDDLIEKYKNMRANGMSYESFMSYFYDQQIALIPQSYYNKDADIKYLPFADAYIGKAHGNGYEHLKRWLKNRLIFTDTLFDYQPSYINDVLTIRANTTEKMTLELETFTPVYQHLSWYNGQMDKKKMNGKDATSFDGYAQAATDQEVLIYGGTNIKSIKGIETCNPSQLLIGYATRVTELDASDCPLLTDINSDKANILPHTYLNTLDLSNCTELGGTLKISNSSLIKNINISNTKITDLQLPSNLKNLENLKLSEHIRVLNIKGAELLTELALNDSIEYISLISMPGLSKVTGSNYSNLKTLIAEGIGFNPVSNILAKADNIEQVRLLDLDIRCSSAHVTKLCNSKGISKDGEEAPIAQCVTGKITIPLCSKELEEYFKQTLPLVEFTILEYAKSYTVKFVDGDGKTIYETQVLENEEAFYLGDTPTKTSTAQYDYEWKGWDRQLKPIMSDVTINATFDNILRYYTIRFISSITLEVVSSQYLAYGSNPTKPEITDGNNAWKPSTIESVTKDFDYYTQYIPYPEDLSIFNFYSIEVNDISGYTCELKADDSTVRDMKYIIIPFEYNDKPVLSYSQTELPSFTYLSVEEFYVPDSLVALGNHAFCKTNKLKSDLVFPNVSRFTYSNTYVSDNIEQMFDCCYAPKIAFPKIQHYKIYDYKDGSPFSNSGSNLVVFGSPEYPFKSWTDDTSSNAGSFGYLDNSNLIINLVTENGLASDVTIKMTPNSLIDKFIFTKAPMLFGVTDNGLEYAIDDNGCSIISYSGNDTEVTIPNEIENVIVTKIGKSVFIKNTTITKVNAPSVTSLGNYCFYNCTKLTTIELPSVTSLGINCFYECTKLTSIELPLATSLGEYCFYNCYNLTSINLPLVTSLSNSCFYGCSALASIELPSATTLGNDCFKSCYNLTSIELPLVTNLGASCFYGCTKLTSIDSPSATSLGRECFKECTNLTTIELPLVTSLGINCFYNCTKLTSIELPSATSLGANCFFGCTSLTSIEIPLATTLGNYCFCNCTKLTSIDLPNVTSLGNSCFSGCKALTSVNSPSATSLGKECFKGCTNLTTIDLPLVISLGNQCFYECTNLSSIELPLVTSLGRECFKGCTNLTTMELPLATSLDNGCFYECTSLASIELPNVTSLGSGCFEDCTNLTTMELPNVTSLGSSCFSNCTKLTSIELPLVTTLGNGCFYECTKLASIELPLVTSLGNYCFYRCQALTSVNSPSATSLGEECFYGCIKLASIELPLATSLGSRCFYICSALSSIELPLVTSLGEYCFSNCNSLKSITFGYIGKPISDTSGFSTAALNPYVTTLTIYVTSPSSPPTLTGSPWDATNATIIYEQA